MHRLAERPINPPEPLAEPRRSASPTPPNIAGVVGLDGPEPRLPPPETRPAAVASVPIAAVSPRIRRVPHEVEGLKGRLHQRLIADLDVERLDALAPGEARAAVDGAVRSLLAREAPALSGDAGEDLVRAVTSEVFGYGPLEPLLADASISEIMVNGPDRVFVERNGKLQLSEVRFRDAAHVLHIIDRIVSRVGRRVDESSPMVDARLPDGSRVNVVVPPVTPDDAPSITIRKFKQDKMGLADLIAYGSMTTELAEFIAGCVRGKLNVIISGGTGTGKTTLLNALSSAIPADERVVTIEDPRELRLQQQHVVTLEARPASVNGKHEVTQRDLVRNALRMRPDRIIVGEVRGPEAFDMLQAMNTGHDGSISTVHANTPRDALARIENMVLMANLDLPVRAIREQVSSAVDLIVQVTRHPDGGRRITYVTEVAGMEGDAITLQDVFVFEQQGIDGSGRITGRFTPSGLRPGFTEKLEQNGIHFASSVFGIDQEWGR
ncbi:MAG: CpaF family protein [Dehalococcoidia bacterium]|nr:MAG: CpaF family protein [Dehalococcoidia bacterium]